MQTPTGSFWLSCVSRRNRHAAMKARLFKVEKAVTLVYISRTFPKMNHIVSTSLAGLLLVCIHPVFAQETTGIPWTGEPGVTVTVGELMRRQAAQPVGPPVQRRPRLRQDRDHLPQNPGSPVSPGNSARGPFASNEPAAPQAGTLAPQTVGVNFLAVTLAQAGFVPPDTMGDVGPNQIVVCVNSRIRTFTKAGVADGALDANADVFFSSVSAGSGTTDPRVRYDRLTGRWFVSMLNLLTPDRIMIAMSSGPSITSTSSFTFFQFQHDLVGTTPNADTGGFADYDTLGVDNKALYIGVNVFNPGFIGTTGYVINKAALLTNTLQVTTFRQIGGTTSGIYTPQGVHNDDPASTEGYFIGVDVATFGRLVLRRVSNPGGTPTISSSITLTVPTTSSPLNPKPLGSTKTLDALDDRPFAAMMKKGRLWMSHNIQVNTNGVASSTGGRDGARWYEIINLATAPTVNQSGTVFDPSASSPSSYWIPACAMSGQGHMALGSSIGGAAEHAEIGVVGRFAMDPLGTVQTTTVAQTSSTSYNFQHQNGQRWGDYSVVTVDPNDDMTMWTFQEYCNATDSYGIRVIQLKAPPPATPASCTPSSVARGTTTNVSLAGTVASGSGFFDPGTGYSNHISAAVNGGSVTVNTVTYNNPSNLTLNVTIGAAAALGGRTITVTNPDAQAMTSASILTIIAGGATNSLPVINAASISPASPSTTNNLIATVTSAFDADSDPITFAYQWQESTTNIAFVAATLPATVTFVGGSYRCIITPNDGQGNGPAFTTTAVLVPVDFDADGLNDDWEIANFGSLGAQTATGDPDGDGFNNAKEFAAGTNPNSAASALVITSVAPVGNDFVITFASVSGKSYRMQRCDDLPAGIWSTVADVTAAGSTTQASDLNGALQPNRNYRVMLLP